ncbi:hypothetical protein [Halobaculum sp. D14]|uniref:hypothetical protein n=1 Tax=Halobaculum sp. D14 TaxID=3421642 RepID=UPI003EB7C4E8
MPSRRRVVRAAAAGLAGVAGCGRSLRANDVPGGLKLVNRRTEQVSVVVRAALQPESTPASPTPTPEGGPSPLSGDEVTVSGRFVLPASSTRFSPGFFEHPGRYVVEVTWSGQREREEIELYRTVGGGVGVDTVVVRVDDAGLSVSVTHVD